MMRKWLCQADVTVRLHPVDPILVKSGYATLDGPEMVPVCTFINGKQTYYFPGSSLKGVLRSHLEKIARTLQPGSVCIPYYENDPKKKIPVPVPSERNSFGCGYRSRGDGRDPSAAAYSDSCAACRLFGSLKFAGRISIGDAYPLSGHDPKPEQRNGVGIDRFTGGTVTGVLFDLQVLVGGVFETKIRVVNFELWQMAALNILLTDLADEIIQIGSGRSRGLGRVRGEVSDLRLSFIRPVTQLEGMFGLATAEERAEYGLHDWAPAAPIAMANPVQRGLRHEYDLTATWLSGLQGLMPAFESFLQWHGGPKGHAGAVRERLAAGSEA